MEKLPRVDVGFLHYWPGWTRQVARKAWSFLAPHYDVHFSNTPDILFCSVFDGVIKGKAERDRPVFPRKGCRRVFITAENVDPPMDRFDYCISFNRDIKSPRHFRIPNYVFRYRANGRSVEGLIKKPQTSGSCASEHDRFCSFVYRRPDVHYRTEFIDSPTFRNDFARALSQYKRVDCPGECCSNMPRLPGRDALEFYRNYKFNIAFENCRCRLDQGYVTEKLVDTMMAGCMPIYWGDLRVGEDFNADSFLCVNDCRNIQEAVDMVAGLDSDDELFNEKMQQPWLRNNVLPDYLTDDYLLQVFRTIFEGKIK